MLVIQTVTITAFSQFMCYKPIDTTLSEPIIYMIVCTVSNLQPLTTDRLTTSTSVKGSIIYIRVIAKVEKHI